ncbi:MAG TPA: NPCBM/NEW2 domain-containing protein [Candidatus Paceibacterota bacterium]|nr:NPCBM/NEW2 domain-containing protein [Verrucomicrobiota bacterium]HSA11089.1 NPCBM/NEW2 domain-containing protein [Candidatus Paceibacterota bacterium]
MRKSLAAAALLCPLLAIGAQTAGAAVGPAELAEARRWAAAKLAGAQAPEKPEPGLVVLANHGPVQKNARGARPLHLGEKEFTRGLFCHAPSKILVLLPGAGGLFEAVAGVDTNDQTSGGRGSVDFSVKVRGEERFRSGMMREGMAGKRVAVKLAGATEFVLQIEETPDGIACDQADWAEAKVTLLDGSTLWLADLPLREGERAAYSTDAPFSFVYDGRNSAELLKAWPCQRSARKLDAQRTERTAVWTDPATGLQVRLVGIEYGDFPTVEWVVHFRNTGPADTPILSDIQAVDLTLRRTGSGEYVLNHHAGDDCSPNSYAPRRLTLEPKSEHRFAPAGGRPTSVGFPCFNLEWPGEGLIVVIGWPGQWNARFTRDADDGLQMRGGQELTRFKLHPGEEARSPLIALQFWQGDRVRAQNVWRRWMLAHNLPRTRDGKPPPPILSSCSGGFFPGIRTSEEGERQFITGFAQAGVKLDYWWIDAGWYTCADWPQVGNWMPDPIRYPRGFRPVSELARSKGAGLIVWFEPERVTPGTFLYTNNPAWLLGRDGEQKLLNLGNSDARRWLTDHVDAMLTREGIDFYRQDFNIDPLPYWRAADAPDRQGLAEMRHIEGYLAYWDELRRRHPGLLIDSCASGGRRNDLETLRRAVPLLRSDYQAFDGNPDFAPGNQGHTYGLSSWIPYYGHGAYYTDRDFVYSVRSYLSPAFALCADVRKPGIDWPLIRRLSEQWRQVADCMLGDFYPLTSYQLSEELWLAWQFDLPEQRWGMVQVFRRAGSNYESARLQLRNLDPLASYVVADLDDPAAARELGGRELLEHGLLIAAPGQPSARIITYRATTTAN